MKAIYSILSLLAVATGMASAKEPIDTIQGKINLKSRLTLGGYGEAVMTRNFYSDAWQRYTRPELHKNDAGYGMVRSAYILIFTYKISAILLIRPDSLWRSHARGSFRRAEPGNHSADACIELAFAEHTCGYNHDCLFAFCNCNA